MANYAIMRIEKRKLGAVGRICNHHERLKAEYKSNPDIDPSRTHLNYHIVEPTQYWTGLKKSELSEERTAWLCRTVSWAEPLTG